MGFSAQQILEDIQKFVDGCGGPINEWYVGLASDPRQKLFVTHNVSEKFDAWMYRQASSAEVALSVTKTLLDIGCVGDSSSDDDGARTVYIYHTTWITSP